MKACKNEEHAQLNLQAFNASINLVILHPDKYIFAAELKSLNSIKVQVQKTSKQKMICAAACIIFP